jgi:hypothetical protein
MPEGWRADAALDGLERAAGPPQLDFGPFQVRSWGLHR